MPAFVAVRYSGWVEKNISPCSRWASGSATGTTRGHKVLVLSRALHEERDPRQPGLHPHELQPREASGIVPDVCQVDLFAEGENPSAWRGDELVQLRQALLVQLYRRGRQRFAGSG